MDRPKRVLFLCTRNSARSQMAEAFLRRFGGDRFEVSSAGLRPQPVDPMTIQVMEEIGIDISDQQSKSVKEYLGKEHFNYVIPVCKEAEENCPRAFLGVAALIPMPFEDPSEYEGSEEGRLAKFREVRNDIETRIKSWVDEMG